MFISLWSLESATKIIKKHNFISLLRLNCEVDNGSINKIFFFK